MNIDFVASIAILGLSALLLHLKSHIKFIAFGLFVGLVLAQTAAVPLYEYLAPRFSIFNHPPAINVLQFGLLLLPTLILGFNHSVDKKGFGLIKTILYVTFTTLGLLACLVSFLPVSAIQTIQSHSLVAFELVHYRNPLVVIVAILLVVDSFHHRQKSLIRKSKKK